MIKYLMALFLVAGMGFSSAAQAAPKDDFAAYWSQFRTAIMADDWAAVQKLTAATVTVHGQLDVDPAEKVSREKLKSAFNGVLQQDTGMAAETLTNKQLIDQTPTLLEGKNFSLRDKTARVGDMVFRYMKGQWMLAEIYLER